MNASVGLIFLRLMQIFLLIVEIFLWLLVENFTYISYGKCILNNLRLKNN